MLLTRLKFKRNFLLDVLHLMYPNNCLICQESLSKAEEHLCLSCLYKLPRSQFHLQPDNPIEKRFWGKVAVHHASSLYLFEKGGSVQKIMHQIKYKGNKELAVYMGRQLGLALNSSSFYTDVDYIIPVPLHVNRQRKRGYNQSELLSEGIALAMQKELHLDNLLRLIENPTQTKKTVFERWENTQGIFGLKNPALLHKKHVLLVDDVLTTGSTLEACVQAILQCPSARVSIVTLAMA